MKTEEIISNNTNNDIIPPLQLQAVLSTETEDYNDSVDFELKDCINKLLQAHIIGFKYI